MSRQRNSMSNTWIRNVPSLTWSLICLPCAVFPLNMRAAAESAIATEPVAITPQASTPVTIIRKSISASLEMGWIPVQQQRLSCRFVPV